MNRNQITRELVHLHADARHPLWLLFDDKPITPEALQAEGFEMGVAHWHRGGVQYSADGHWSIGCRGVFPSPRTMGEVRLLILRVEGGQ